MGNHTVIAFLQYEGRTLVLELSPLPGKPGYFDAAVVTLTKAESPKHEPRRGSRRGRATEITRKRADEAMIWLNNNLGTHMLYDAMRKALGNLSPGSTQAVAKELARRRLVKVNLKTRPHTVSTLEAP